MAKNKNKPTKETIEMDKSNEVLSEVKPNKKNKKEDSDLGDISNSKEYKKNVKARKKENNGSDYGEISSKANKKAKTNKTKKKKNDKPRRNYGKEVVSELKKVNWPSFKNACKQTGTVLVVVGVFALAVLGIDSLVAWILSLITKI